MYLVSHRDEGYYWDSTEQTAMVIYGLTDYLERTQELKPNYSVEVQVNGKTVATKKFTAGRRAGSGDDGDAERIATRAGR